MPPKKRKPIGKVLPEHRLRINRERASTSRAAYSLEQRENRLQQERDRASTSRAAESLEQRENRLQQDRDRASTSKAAYSLEQRENRLQQERDRASTSRAAESLEQRENRLQQERDRASTSRAAESLEQRENRLQQERDRASTSRAAESLEQRENRLQQERDRASTSRAAESVGQRENRLRQNRNRVSTSRAAETPQEHTARILNVRERTLASRNSRDRLSNLLLEGFNYDSCKNYEQHPSITIGQMSIVCNYCKAKKFKDEPPGFCCKNGKVYLSPPQLPPDELFSLMSCNSSESNHFLRNIRKYNSCFQMSSFGATSFSEESVFPTTFRVQGQVYHRAGSLLPSLDQPPQFLQIFFVEDAQLEVNQRCHFSSALRHGTVLCLQRMFHRCNQLIKIFKTALENMPSDEYKLVIRADKTPSGEHERRFNAPQSNDVAVVLSADEFNQRDIIIQRRSNALQRISETHRSYDPLQYPIIFWEGEDGYHFNYRQIDQNSGVPTNKKVSAMSFYSYRIIARDNVYNHILNCRQLFSQYIVDMYAKIESERLLYIRLNQKELRVEEYIHLRDAVANDGMVANFGKLVILPATFTGSPRHMHEYTQDAMVFVRTYGRPDLFITFTCNPSWPEMNAELFNGQKPMDRHDLTARVFKLKLNKLIALITKKCIFGETRCWMFTIEWQKRGLPHSHILIWLKDKIHPIQIDNVISAEIPNPEEDPNLYEVVIKNMIHGPCGTFNINAPCMKNGKCSKNYPRDLISDTQTGFDGYPRYRRRAPENGVKSIKYICKYVNKGNDMAIFGLSKENTNDEISQYLLGRYISSNEAVWRILSFPIHERHPNVVHLSVHLENGQRVYFTNANARTVAAAPPNTTLTAFFQLCQQDPFAKKLLYPEVPRYYTWNASRKSFCRRKQGTSVPENEGIFASEALGRVYTVHPNNAECFFLRMLLHTVRGPTSFSSLKCVNGEECRTFREACQNLGLLEDDQHWDNVLSEAASQSFPEQIRELFAILLTTCNPSNPQNLWEKYRESMSEDVLIKARRANPTLDINFSSDIFNEALLLLQNKRLAINDKALSQLGLQSPERCQPTILNRKLMREKNYNIEQLRSIMDCIKKQQGGIIFLDAPGGTGKTFLINLLLAEVRSKNAIALAIASSGIAATLIAGGCTAHSMLKLPLNIANEQYPTCNISSTSGQAQVLKSCRIIVWDECTMAHKHSLEALDRTLRDLKGNNKLMGGIILLLAGDFRQTLPVIPRSTPADEINACLKASVLWKHIKKITLRTNLRVQVLGDHSAQNFARKLLQIGEGTFPNGSPMCDVSFPLDFGNIVSSVGELRDKVFPNLAENFKNHRWLCERTILAPRNDAVDEINNCIQDMLPGSVTEYNSINTMVDVDDTVNYPSEFLNSLNPSGLPPHHLRLKIGSPIMLLRNLDPPKLCNGTRLCVKRLLPNVIEATILTGKENGKDVLIPRIPLVPNDFPFLFKRLQFPVQLAFAITINKAQGQSLKCCGCKDRSDLLHGKDTTTTSVGRYCDQGSWTDLICSMDKTPPPPQLVGFMDRSDLLHGQDTTTTSVGRYCDQGSWTDLICSMEKTPPPPQLAGFMDRSDLLHGQDTITSVGRYCDQGSWTDLICSMDKTPSPQLASIIQGGLGKGARAKGGESYWSVGLVELSPNERARSATLPINSRRRLWVNGQPHCSRTILAGARGLPKAARCMENASFLRAV
ncbi:hypothetical protein LAZ67_13000048 [Cordylochernes scorpioides]|uniref:ATP-dependent DNA helicase n=1 Tax=Cordylochernes scorpioides TaxID=51811 RepID=A0ABY6L6J3_9ARAC|nr:hypothetical protein LAZ67_13000048 [Cordylochernes scorpioides]